MGNWVVTRLLPGIARASFRAVRRLFLRPQNIEVFDVASEDGSRKRRYLDVGAADRPWTPTHKVKARAPHSRTPESVCASRLAAANTLRIARDSPQATVAAAAAPFVPLRPGRPLFDSDESLESADDKSLASAEVVEDVDGVSIGSDASEDDTSFLRDAIFSTPPGPATVTKHDAVPAPATVPFSKPVACLIQQEAVPAPAAMPFFSKPPNAATLAFYSKPVDPLVQHKAAPSPAAVPSFSKPVLARQQVRGIASTRSVIGSPRSPIDKKNSISHVKVRSPKINDWRAEIRDQKSVPMGSLRCTRGTEIFAPGYQGYGTSLMKWQKRPSPQRQLPYGSKIFAGQAHAQRLKPTATLQSLNYPSLSMPKTVSNILDGTLPRIPTSEIQNQYGSDANFWIPNITILGKGGRPGWTSIGPSQNNSSVFQNFAPSQNNNSVFANVAPSQNHNSVFQNFAPSQFTASMPEPLLERLDARATAQPDLDQEHEARRNSAPDFHISETVDHDMSFLDDAPDVEPVKQVHFNEVVDVWTIPFWTDPLTDFTPEAHRKAPNTGARANGSVGNRRIGPAGPRRNIPTATRRNPTGTANSGGGASDVASSTTNLQDTTQQAGVRDTQQPSTQNTAQQVNTQGTIQTNTQGTILANTQDTAQHGSTQNTTQQTASGSTTQQTETKTTVDEAQEEADSELFDDLIAQLEDAGLNATIVPYDTNGKVIAAQPLPQAPTQVQPLQPQPASHLLPLGGPVHPLVTALSPGEETTLNDAVVATDNGLRKTALVGRSRLQAQDFATLLPQLFRRENNDSSWLNDSIVNEYLKILTEDIKSQDGFNPRQPIGAGPVPRVHAFVSFWTQSNGAAGWATKAHLAGSKYLEAETILYPVCDANHWRLLAVSPKERKIEYFDSLDQDGAKYIKKLKFIISKTIGPDHWVPSEWTVEQNQRSLRQVNGSDCGVFTVLNALALLRKVNHNRVVVSDGMNDARKRIAVTIIKQRATREFS